jgi:hypothetical protein
MTSTMLLMFACSERVVDLDDTSAGLDLFGTNDTLASPYVLGGQLTFTVTANRFWGDPGSWDLVASSGVELTALSDAAPGMTSRSYDAVFTEAGTHTLEVRDGDRVLDSVDIQVFDPDQLELHPRSAEMAGLDVDPLTELTLLAGSQSAWDVRYLADNVELYGNDAMTVEAPDSFGITFRSYSEREQDELLVIDAPDAAGAYTLTLLVAGQERMELPVLVIEQDRVADLQLENPDETEANEGDSLNVVVRGWMDDGTEVHGIEAEWVVLGELQEVRGDRYAYTYDERIERSLTARLGEGQAEVLIHGQGTVGSTVSCSSGAVPAGLLLSLLGLVGVRRLRE